MQPPEIIALNESTLLLQWNREPDRDLLQNLLALQHCLQQQPFAGYRETVTAYNSMAVFYEPAAVELHQHPTVFTAVTAYVWLALQWIPEAPATADKIVTIPVCYDASNGPDLATTAAEKGMDVPTFTALHSSKLYDVYAIAFMPGFPYLGFLPPLLETLRRERPRPHVPAGSVAIAGRQTGIYPFSSPGGWNIIGRTPLELFDPDRDPPFLLEAGDRVQFEAISSKAYTQMQQPGSSKEPDTSFLSNISPLLQVEHGGYQATLHDGGRIGYRNRGLPVCGPTAPFTARLANSLVGNEPSATVLELPQARYRFRVLEGAVFAFTGGGLQPTLNGNEVALNKPFWAPAGSLLELQQPKPGYRLYLAVSGGWAAQSFMGSTATDLRLQRGGMLGRVLKTGDILHQQQPLTTRQQHLAELLHTGVEMTFQTAAANNCSTPISVLPGPDWNQLPALIQQKLREDSFTVLINSNRSGWHIDGHLPRHVHAGNRYSAPVTTGTVQYTPSGELLVLGPDGPTMGGYPHVLQLTAGGLNSMAQLRPGDTFRWMLTDIATAEKLYLEQEAGLQRIGQTLQEWL